MIIREYFYPGCSILVGKCPPTFTGERNTLNLYFLDQDNHYKNSFFSSNFEDLDNLKEILSKYIDQDNLKDTVFVLILMRTAGTTTTQ